MRFRIAFAAGVMSISLASTLRPQVPAREYDERRAALAARIDSGVVLAFGAVEPVVYWPGMYQHYFSRSGDMMEGATWRDPDRVDEWSRELSPDAPVVVYCAYG